MTVFPEQVSREDCHAYDWMHFEYHYRLFHQIQFRQILFRLQLLPGSKEPYNLYDINQSHNDEIKIFDSNLG